VTHSPILETATLHWSDEAACARAAAALAAAAPQDAVITLEGGLGAGKTTFVRHFLQALGVQGHIRSPTYTVMESYDVGWPISHFDFYRFEGPQEWEDAGFRDVFALPGLKLCEWPQKVQVMMPARDLTLHLHADEQGRRHVRLHACSALGCRLARAIRSS